MIITKHTATRIGTRHVHRFGHLGLGRQRHQRRVVLVGQTRLDPESQADSRAHSAGMVDHRRLAWRVVGKSIPATQNEKSFLPHEVRSFQRGQRDRDRPLGLDVLEMT